MLYLLNPQSDSVQDVSGGMNFVSSISQPNQPSFFSGAGMLGFTLGSVGTAVASFLLGQARNTTATIDVNHNFLKEEVVKSDKTKLFRKKNPKKVH